MQNDNNFHNKQKKLKKNKIKAEKALKLLTEIRIEFTIESL